MFLVLEGIDGSGKTSVGNDLCNNRELRIINTKPFSITDFVKVVKRELTIRDTTAIPVKRSKRVDIIVYCIISSLFKDLSDVDTKYREIIEDSVRDIPTGKFLKLCCKIRSDVNKLTKTKGYLVSGVFPEGQLQYRDEDTLKAYYVEHLVYLTNRLSDRYIDLMYLLMPILENLQIDNRDIILLDRWVMSTYAYNYGMGGTLTDIAGYIKLEYKELNKFTYPDKLFTIFIDSAPNVASKRRSTRDGKAEVFEDKECLERTFDVYSKLILKTPRITCIPNNSRTSYELLMKRVYGAINDILLTIDRR